MKNIFDKNVSDEVIGRIQELKTDLQPLWGKMSVGQMLAHCNVTYEMVYEDKHPKPGAIKKGILKMLVKNAVVSDKGYPKNSRTAPQFLITGEREFNTEKERLIGFINKTQQLGGSHFEGKESHSFGPLTTAEWNNMFYKHLDHHLTQFGV